MMQNEMLRQRLRVEQDELGAERRRREEGVAALTRETIALKHATRHLSAATFHATSCRNRRRCSICIYARRTFANIDNYRDKWVISTFLLAKNENFNLNLYLVYPKYHIICILSAEISLFAVGISCSAFKHLYKIFVIGYDLTCRRPARLEFRKSGHPLPIGKFLTSMTLVPTVVATAVLTAVAAVAVLAAAIALTMMMHIQVLRWPNLLYRQQLLASRIQPGPFLQIQGLFN